MVGSMFVLERETRYEVLYFAVQGELALVNEDSDSNSGEELHVRPNVNHRLGCHGTMGSLSKTSRCAVE